MSVPGIVGGAVGFFLGGPKGALYGYQLGSIAGALINPPKGPNVEGPRLADQSVQTATYGANIPRGYGTFPVLGNVFWLEDNKLKEVTTKTTQRAGKGGKKKTTTTTFSYYATFAVGLCEGPITGVRRIWVGSRLIFDAGSATLAELSASAEASSLFTVHYGTDTQLADARMQATLGDANTPAYRGLAYLVFLDYPLKDHGNSLLAAQVKVEVVKAGTISPISFVATGHSFSFPLAQGQPIDPKGYMWVNVGSSNLLRIHLPSGAVAARRPKIASDGQSIVPYGYNQAGTLLAETNGGQMLMIRPSGEEVFCPSAVGVRQYAFGTTEEIWAVPWSGLRIYSASLGMITANAPASGEYRAIFAGTVIGRWVHFRWSDSTTDWLCRFDPVTNVFEQLFVIPSGYAGLEIGLNLWRVVAGADGMFYMYDQANDTVAKFDSTGTLLATGTSAIGTPVMYHGDGKIVCRSTTYPTRYRVCTTAALEVLPGYTEDSGVECRDTHNSGYMSLHSATAIIVDTIASSTAPLSDIVSTEMLASNLLTGGDLDVASLTQAVRGYKVSSLASIRSALEPLQAAWPFDVVAHGYEIKCVPRGGTSIATVTAGELDARPSGSAPGVAITNTREMDLVLPRRVSIKFLDADREFDPGEQYAERLNTTAVNVRSIDMAIVLTATEAAQIAERLLYLYWLERYDIEFALPPTFNQVEPADVITIAATEGTYSARLTGITYTPDGRLEARAKYNSAAIYVPVAVGESGQSTGDPVVYIGDASTEMLDIPLMLDSFDEPGFPVAMCGFGTNWPGGGLYAMPDSGQTWDLVQGFPSPGSVIGLAMSSIGAGRTDLIDTASVLSISLRAGDLISVTESAMLDGANHFAYGVHGRWEIIAAKTCTFESADGTYTLTNLLRGRFGTEWACGLHGANDTLVLLDTDALAWVTATVNAIGSAKTYRGVTSGKELSSAVDIPFTYAGVNLECLSPCYLNGNRHPSTNDWTLDWLRRTRVGGEWRDYVDATLGEASESYEVDIFSSNTYVTLKRTLTSATATVAYTSTQQVTDFGSNQGTLYVKVYQLSANVGRGYPLTTSITR